MPVVTDGVQDVEVWRDNIPLHETQSAWEGGDSEEELCTVNSVRVSLKRFVSSASSAESVGVVPSEGGRVPTRLTPMADAGSSSASVSCCPAFTERC